MRLEAWLVITLLIFVVTIIAFIISRAAEWYRGENKQAWADYSVALFFTGLVTLGLMTAAIKNVKALSSTNAFAFIFLNVMIIISHLAWVTIFIRLRNANFSRVLEAVQLIVAILHIFSLAGLGGAKLFMIAPSVIWVFVIIYLTYTIYNS